MAPRDTPRASVEYRTDVRLVDIGAGCPDDRRQTLTVKPSDPMRGASGRPPPGPGPGAGPGRRRSRRPRHRLPVRLRPTRHQSAALHVCRRWAPPPRRLRPDADRRPGVVATRLDGRGLRPDPARRASTAGAIAGAGSRSCISTSTRATAPSSPMTRAGTTSPAMSSGTRSACATGATRHAAPSRPPPPA